MLIAALASLVLVQYGSYASNDEIKAAETAYSKCLLQHAATMDDGISDAATIAQGVAPACVSELRNVEETYTRGENPQLQLMIRERLNATQQSEAVTAVLAVRRVRRSKQPQ